ncbi:MAG: alanine racemase [Balneolaceae bacterium]|nr:alanine racemase [Balneolaceae bacterium]
MDDRIENKASGIHGYSEIEIDLSALEQNLKLLKKELISGTEVMAVVKAEAYGHGMVPLAEMLEGQVAWFAVNSPGEGKILRESGINLPILVFNAPGEQQAPIYRNYNLTATVSDLRHFEILPEGSSYHLNIDTGMGRLGLLPDDMEEVIQKVESYSHLNCAGIYSHFATAEDPGSQKAVAQIDMFKVIRSRFDDSLITHMANTGGTVFYPDAHFDMVRPGIGLYGYSPGQKEIPGLQPVLSWRSQLAQVKKVAPGDTVSYGAVWEAPEEGYIGIVPVGYREGVWRSLTGRFSVAIEGDLFPAVGTVTMNYFIVFLGQNEKPAGSRVQIMGEAPADNAKYWAAKVESIPYEILTRLSDHIPRIYSR